MINRRWLAIAVVVAAALVPVESKAAEVLEEGGALSLTLQKSLDAETARYGDAFEGALSEEYQYNNRVLPAGAVLKGQVKSAHKSYSLGFPGYVTLDIQELLLPDGQSIRLGKLQTDKVAHPKAKNHFKLLKSGLPFSAVSAADGIPLKYAAGLSSWEILPISLAARMALGVSMEALDYEREKHSRKNHPLPTRVGHGILRGTGLTGAYYLLSPSPEPDLAQGRAIPIHLDKKELEILFAHGRSLQARKEAPATTEE